MIAVNASANAVPFPVSIRDVCLLLRCFFSSPKFSSLWLSYPFPELFPKV